ncbi:DEAD/DEAH box helicase [Candidatus Viridilinea mediisalina]|uniref:Helicase n=1 Tax=Candidatus Viridilinea mediisalina TaxID=2024553 RepID=A0A2A6RHY9_9CHLR|nr:SNF2-related protein [Candidatus Viridilinea mediisalina]PDW02506.1 hypothetical protein CJ255_13570 [Candidatus Viridilinea mediisalina]
MRHQRHGLGIVDRIDARQVTVAFDSGQQQTFGCCDQDLCRAAWPVGALVMVRHKGLVGKVLNVITSSDLYQYMVQLSISGDTVTVAEGGLADYDYGPQMVDDPLEGLVKQQFEHPELFYARTAAHYLACSRQTLVSSGATARIDPLPHQIFVGQRVVTAPRPRFLLADEVGLGKTIEAGLVIQELRARGALRRVLVIVPANLTFQWCTELEQKFNERFTVYDASVLRELRNQAPRSNPWLLRDNIILSHGVIEHNERLWDEIVNLPWDLVVVDEAHHARRRQTSGDRRETTRLYRFVSRLSERTRGLLLLTATPMQLQTFELFSLVELLDCGLFQNYEHFERQRQVNRHINELMKALDHCDQAGGTHSPELAARLRTQLPKEHHDLVAQLGTSAAARQRLTQLLAERHLLSEVMIRNRKRVIGKFTNRQPHIIPVTLSPEERALYTAVTAYVRDSYSQLDRRRRGVVGFLLVAYQRRMTSCTYALRVTIERRLQKLQAAMSELEALPAWSEDEDLDEILNRTDQVAFGTDPAAIMIERRSLEELRRLAASVETDTKFVAFSHFLYELFRRNPTEQVLIFTQFYDTLHYLQGQLRSRWRVGTFHGSLNPKEKDYAINQFRSGATQILISTEAGGEGRNLQFCAVLVNYDLPWNPMKIEQRIGRIDRIGQRRDVLICNFAQQGTVEDRVLDMLSQRIHIFEETVGGLDPILGELESDIQKIVLETPLDQLDAALERRAAQLERDTEQARQIEEAQRDFVVDLRSFNQQTQVVFDKEEQHRLLEVMQNWSRLMLKQVGAQVELQDDGSLTVKLGKASGGILPEVRQRYFEITFDYQQALENPEFEYGSFGHPLFDALIAYGTSETFARGAVTQRTIRSDAHEAFTGFQFNFIIEERSVHTTRSLVVIAIDDEGSYRPEITNLLLESREWEQPTSGITGSESANWAERVERAHAQTQVILKSADWAERVERAHDQAQIVLNRLLRERRTRRKAEYEPLLQAEEQRINRYCATRLHSGQEKLAHDRAILQRLQQSHREEDRKVIPIWKRNVENAEAYLRTIAEEHETQLKELANRRQVTHSSNLLNAARISVIATVRPHTVAVRCTETDSLSVAVDNSVAVPARKPRAKRAAIERDSGSAARRTKVAAVEKPAESEPKTITSTKKPDKLERDTGSKARRTKVAAVEKPTKSEPKTIESTEKPATPTDGSITMNRSTGDDVTPYAPASASPPPPSPAAPPKRTVSTRPPLSDIPVNDPGSNESGPDIKEKMNLKGVVKFIKKSLRKLF